jgi:hypothetical protein
MAASPGITEATLMAEFRSSLEAHGERAEDKLQNELSGWLVKFVNALYKDEIRIQEWEKLKYKCDVVVLLQHLYLFTYFGKTTADVLQDACRFLKDELDKLLPKCSALCEDMSTLFNHPKLRILTVLSPKMQPTLAEPETLIRNAEDELWVMRQWAEKMGSYKTEAHDFHLYMLATNVRTATAEYHFPELTTLIEAALDAHGARFDSIREDALKRRVERYIKRMNLPRFPPPPRKTPTKKH